MNKQPIGERKNPHFAEKRCGSNNMMQGRNPEASGFFSEDYILDLGMRSEDPRLSTFARNLDLTAPPLQLYVARTSLLYAIGFLASDRGFIEIFTRLVPNTELGDLQERSYRVNFRDTKSVMTLNYNMAALARMAFNGSVQGIPQFLDELTN